MVLVQRSEWWFKLWSVVGGGGGCDCGGKSNGDTTDVHLTVSVLNMYAWLNI